ncbi:MAG: sugar phosphate isomerase/epimerase [Spirochaetaceae bacterium]|jgi:inosose dehydratase|nr:sugar phosphate isomerase/epimerase [Spirochaetaceae bacterium]
MALKVSPATAPCSWGVWYADGGPSRTPWNIFLDQAAEAGYDSLELGPGGYLPADEGALREELARRRLSVAAGTACYRFDRYGDFSDFRAPLEALCRRIQAFNGSFLVTMDESDVGRFGEKKKTYPPGLWEKYFTMFREMGGFTKNEFGIETVFHPHIRSLIETEGEIIRLIDRTGLRLCFDNGHYVYVNGGIKQGDRSASDFIRAHAESIAYLHFKNVDGKIRKRVLAEGFDSDTAFDMDVMCDLREGIIDYLELKETLNSIDFRGIGVIEMDMPRASTAEAFAAAKRNLAYLKEIAVIG